jgi:hypothetical protein
MGFARIHRPRYEADEWVLGVAATFAVHAIIFAPFIYRAFVPASPAAEEKEAVPKPVVNATLLRLGTPLDPKKLPDRFVPHAKTAPKPEKIASRETPQHHVDAGAPPPPDAIDDKQTRLNNKNDIFPEDAGKDRPLEGHQSGIDGGEETDPNKVRAGDMYGAILSKFFSERMVYPSVISQAEARKLCAVYQVKISSGMIIWYLKVDAVRKSGNDLFDDAARSMLQKLLDDRVGLPEPPSEVAASYKGQRVNIAISGDLHGDASKCK